MRHFLKIKICIGLMIFGNSLNTLGQKITYKKDLIYKDRTNMYVNGLLSGYSQTDPFISNKTNYYDSKGNPISYSKPNALDSNRKDIFDVKNNLIGYEKVNVLNPNQITLYNFYGTEVGTLSKDVLTGAEEFTASVNQYSNSFSDQFIKAEVPDIIPFSPDFSLLENVFRQAALKQQKMLNAGYVYDKVSGEYKKAESIENEINNRRTDVSKFEAEHRSSSLNETAFKDGEYYAKIYSTSYLNERVYDCFVTVKKNYIKKIKIPGRVALKPFREKISIKNGIAEGVVKATSASIYISVRILVYKSYPYHK